MRIHIGWVLLFCFISAISGAVLAYSHIQDIVDIKFASLLLKVHTTDFNALNSAYIAIDSGNTENAKKIISELASKNYSLVKEVSSIMSEDIHRLALVPDLKLANSFLENHKNDRSINNENYPKVSNNSFERDPVSGSARPRAPQLQR